MSTSFSANQYENAFNSQKLQNWTVPKHFKERPSAAEGYTTFIATDRGHLLPGVRTKHGSAWPSFQGTWDLPRRIPPVHINPTARSQGGQDRLRTWGWTKSATIQAHEAPAGSQASNRTFQNVENIYEDQPAEESKMYASNPDQNESEVVTEKPNFQHNQAESRTTSSTGQQAQLKPVNLAQSNQPLSTAKLS
ncbi:protein Flattop-like [Xyrauchen texanus]|uniref:protein Flattop-like n=1 Tax=Xyrauchen texanus TaxID=154827 RepID=UPI00224215CE|nr:protein Flattop-like [Xyrauchen texanus]